MLALAAAGVDFIIVGVGGINFFARTPAQSFSTLDLDAFIAPTVENLELALSVLAELGYRFEAGGEPFVDTEEDPILRRVIANGSALAAIHREQGQINLLTSISGFAYSDLTSDAVLFEVEGTRVRVGRLTKLLRSKEASGRPKDLDFLRIYEATLADEES